MNHDSYPEGYIRAILTGVHTVAIVGASNNISRPSFFVLKYLIQKGYNVYPINPGHAGEKFLDRPVYARLADVPEPIHLVDVFRKPEALSAVVDEALALDPKPKVIWMQLTLRDDAAAARAEAAGVKVVMNRCVKIEYGRMSGEIGWAGVNSRVLSSKKPAMQSGFQHFKVEAED
jgi:predicted CoA-binding protein